MESDKTREDRLRRQANRQGLALSKSRAILPYLDNRGDWMIVDPYRNTIVLGEKWDLTLDDVEEFLKYKKRLSN
jgi:hypothetical protein